MCAQWIVGLTLVQATTTTATFAIASQSTRMELFIKIEVKSRKLFNYVASLHNHPAECNIIKMDWTLNKIISLKVTHPTKLSLSRFTQVSNFHVKLNYFDIHLKSNKIFHKEKFHDLVTYGHLDLKYGRFWCFDLAMVTGKFGNPVIIISLLDKMR